MYKSTKFALISIIISILGILYLPAFVTSNINVNASTDKTDEIFQIPSEATDFPENNQKALQVLFVKANKDSIDDYHIIGSIKNIGNETLNYVKATGHFLDKDLNPVGITTCCYADPTDIEPGHTSAVDSFVSSDLMVGEPSYFRLSFDWDQTS